MSTKNKNKKGKGLSLILDKYTIAAQIIRIKICSSLELNQILNVPCSCTDLVALYIGVLKSVLQWRNDEFFYTDNEEGRHKFNLKNKNLKSLVAFMNGVVQHQL